MNSIIEIAERHGRDYITPEDVSDALRDHDADGVRRDLIEVMGNPWCVFGIEDRTLCAFIAWRGTPTAEAVEQ